MDWRRVNRALHRDLGYLCVGFTLLYAVTGILLNHLHDWNPMYAVSGTVQQVGPLPEGADAEVEAEALRRLGISLAPLSRFRPDPETLEVFFEGGDKLSIHVPTGAVRAETVKRRTLTGRLNDLHLNRPPAPWTYIADGYAAALGLLAVTGALLAARKGSAGRRGLALTAAGLALAVASLAFVR
jgi:hypothetical protein